MSESMTKFIFNFETLQVRLRFAGNNIVLTKIRGFAGTLLVISATLTYVVRVSGLVAYIYNIL